MEEKEKEEEEEEEEKNSMISIERGLNTYTELCLQSSGRSSAI